MQNQTYNGTLTIQNSDSTITVNLKGFCRASIGIINITNEVPSEYKLFQNYPNPFNPFAIIKYSIAMGFPTRAFGDDKVLLKVYDINGKEISTLVNEMQTAGTYEVKFNAVFLPSGIYYYKLTAGSFTDVKKMIVIK